MNIYMNKEYRILQTKEVDDMENLINEYANQGWDPVGGISSQVINGAYCYNQTMVREKINESPDNGKQLLHG